MPSFIQYGNEVSKCPQHLHFMGQLRHNSDTVMDIRVVD